MSRELNADQNRATEERRAKFRAIAKDLAGLNDAQRADIAACVNVVTIEGRGLSVRNMCMLAMQNPAVTMVGGFNQWRSAGRLVKKGERGLMIWAPTTKKNAETGEAGETMFIQVSVFDVSQTQEANQ